MNTRAAAVLSTLCCLLTLGRAQAERRGEAFTYRLSVGMIEGGRARMAITPPKPGARLGSMIGEIEATGLAKVVTQLRDDYRLVYNPSQLLPVRMDLVETGTNPRTLRVDFEGRGVKLFIKTPQGERQLQGAPPLALHDPVTAYLLLRAAPLRDGDRMELTLLDGSAFYRGAVTVKAHETIEQDGAARPAIKVHCHGVRTDVNGNPTGKPPRQGTLWLSDDEKRLPLRFIGETAFGAAQFELTSYEGRPPVLPAAAGLPGVTIGREPPPAPAPPAPATPGQPRTTVGAR